MWIKVVLFNQLAMNQSTNHLFILLGKINHIDNQWAGQQGNDCVIGKMLERTVDVIERLWSLLYCGILKSYTVSLVLDVSFLLIFASASSSNWNWFSLVISPPTKLKNKVYFTRLLRETSLPPGCLSRWGLNPIKQAYKSSRSNGRLY